MDNNQTLNRNYARRILKNRLASEISNAPHHYEENTNNFTTQPTTVNINYSVNKNNNTRLTKLNASSCSNNSITSNENKINNTKNQFVLSPLCKCKHVMLCCLYVVSLLCLFTTSSIHVSARLVQQKTFRSKDINPLKVDDQKNFDELVSEIIASRVKRSYQKIQDITSSTNNANSKSYARVKFDVVDRHGAKLNGQVKDAHKIHFMAQQKEEAEIKSGRRKRAQIDSTERHLRRMYRLHDSEEVLDDRVRRNSKVHEVRRQFNSTLEENLTLEEVMKMKQVKNVDDEDSESTDNKKNKKENGQKYSTPMKQENRTLNSPIEDVYGYLTTVYTMLVHLSFKF